MLTSAFQKLVDINATGTAAKGIKAAKFRGLPIPFPSYKEQTEIVRRVEELFSFADKVEAQVNAAQERVNNLTQSILAKAFRGELTADWRAENPDLISGENSAEALLKKIKAERDLLKTKNKATKKNASKTKGTKARKKSIVDKSSTSNLHPIESLLNEKQFLSAQSIFESLANELSLTDVFTQISHLLKDNKITESTANGKKGFELKQ